MIVQKYLLGLFFSCTVLTTYKIKDIDTQNQSDSLVKLWLSNYIVMMRTHPKFSYTEYKLQKQRPRTLAQQPSQTENFGTVAIFNLQGQIVISNVWTFVTSSMLYHWFNHNLYAVQNINLIKLLSLIASNFVSSWTALCKILSNLFTKQI